MPTLTIDGEEITVENGMTVLQACAEAGVDVPRFCYHERLSIAGNCRMCLVEMERSPKPIASCAMPAGDGMVIHTNTESVKKAREGVMEFLLINHPLDCPICDQGGECDLQDQAMAFGRGDSRFEEMKRAVPDKNMGPLIDTTMTRCIHCMRCVRFSSEVAGVDDMGSLWRGEHTEITTYLDKVLDSELSGNVIDLCPVGALTSKPYAFTARSWELEKTESIDVMDAVGSNIRVDARSGAVMRILPRLHDDVNEEWISDKTRYCYDGLKKRRLDRPYVRKAGKLVAVSWQEAFETVNAAVVSAKGDEIAGIVGDLADAESMYALKTLLSYLGSDRIEARTDGVAIDPADRGGYLFNAGIAGIEEADFILLVGTNPRLEAPLVNTRIRKGVIKRGLKVANVGSAEDLTYRVEELGDNAAILNQIASGSHEVAALLKTAQRPMIILGQGALQRPDGTALLKLVKSLAVTSCQRDGWNGFAMLHTAASRVAALDMGLTTKGGITQLLDDADSGAAKVVFNLGADDIDAEKLKNTVHIYMGTHGDTAVKTADIILPSAAYTEKSGTYINTEGRVQRTQRSVFAPGDAREDWTILRALSDVLGKTLAFDSLTELRAHMVKDFPHMGELDALPGLETKAPGGVVSFDIAGGGIQPAVTDFYATNVIARASDILADVVEARFGDGEEEAEERSGTDG